MSKLYVSADSDTCMTTRTARGSRRVSAHPRGWNVGAKAQVLAAGDNIACYVERTSGSSEAAPSRTVAEWYDGDPSVRFYPTSGDVLEAPNGRRAYTVEVGADGALYLSPLTF